jgi:Protein of unknown function (DUF3040)
VLSDHEQRALEELERCYVTEAQEPVRDGGATRRSARRSTRPPGCRVLVVLACASVALLVTGAPAAAFSLLLATAIGWSSWRLWSSLRGGWSSPWQAVLGPYDAPRGAVRRLGRSIRRYRAWLAEVE